MTTRKFYLVPRFIAAVQQASSSPSINQLELFTGKILTLSTSSATNSSFINLINKEEPKLIVDTREFPDFFSIFKSTQVALKYFDEKNIDYRWIPINTDDNAERWNEIALFKKIVNGHFKNTLDPMLILASTQNTSQEIEDKVKEYISNYEFKIIIQNIDLSLNPL